MSNQWMKAGSATYVIAEVGINHNGDVRLAEEMVSSIADCGADAVKFQTVTAAKSYSKNSPSNAIFSKVELSRSDWCRLVDKSRQKGLDVITSFATESDLELDEKLDFDAIKISSSNVTNFPLLNKVAQRNKPVIMSTGLCYLSEVDEGARYLKHHGIPKLAILQYTSL